MSGRSLCTGSALVDSTTSSRRPRSAFPTIDSVPYTCAVSIRLIPRSSARWTTATDSASRGAVGLAEPAVPAAAQPGDRHLACPCAPASCAASRVSVGRRPGSVSGRGQALRRAACRRGHRGHGSEPDEQRELSERGWRQAEGLCRRAGRPRHHPPGREPVRALRADARAARPRRSGSRSRPTSAWPREPGAEGAWRSPRRCATRRRCCAATETSSPTCSSTCSPTAPSSRASCGGRRPRRGCSPGRASHLTKGRYLPPPA